MRRSLEGVRGGVLPVFGTFPVGAALPVGRRLPAKGFSVGGWCDSMVQKVRALERL